MVQHRLAHILSTGNSEWCNHFLEAEIETEFFTWEFSPESKEVRLRETTSQIPRGSSPPLEVVQWFNSCGLVRCRLVSRLFREVYQRIVGPPNICIIWVFTQVSSRRIAFLMSSRRIFHKNLHLDNATEGNTLSLFYIIKPILFNTLDKDAVHPLKKIYSRDVIFKFRRVATWRLLTSRRMSDLSSWFSYDFLFCFWQYGEYFNFDYFRSCLLRV